MHSQKYFYQNFAQCFIYLPALLNKKSLLLNGCYFLQNTYKYKAFKIQLTICIQKVIKTDIIHTKTYRHEKHNIPKPIILRSSFLFLMN